MLLTDYVGQFLMFKRSYCSPRTVQGYSCNLRLFLEWLARPDATLAVITRQLYVDYLLWLRSGHRNVTVNSYARPLKVFLKWLYNEGHVPEDVTRNVRFPKPDAGLVMPLTNAEVQRIDSQFDLNDYLGLRNYCMIHCMLDCGLRAGAVTRLRKSDVLDAALYVHNDKGCKSRFVPCPVFLLDALHRLIEMDESGSKSLFLDRYGRNPVTYDTLRKVFVNLKRDAGIDRVHSHLLRHTFATSFIYYGGNLEFLRILLGHGSYDITQNYLHIASNMLIIRADIYRIDDVFFNLQLRG